MRSAPFPSDKLATLGDPAVRKAWISMWMGRVRGQGLDGLTLDIEKYCQQAACSSCADRLLAVCWPCAGRVLAVCWPCAVFLANSSVVIGASGDSS